VVASAGFTADPCRVLAVAGSRLAVAVPVGWAAAAGRPTAVFRAVEWVVVLAFLAGVTGGVVVAYEVLTMIRDKRNKSE
jgi:hypothetical protein